MPSLASPHGGATGSTRAAFAPHPRRFALLLSLLLPACHGGPGTETKSGGAPAPVVVAAVVKKDVPVEIRCVGTSEAVSTVQVMPQVGGLIQQVHFHEGDLVKKGDLLFTIDTRPYTASLSAAQAELEKNQALAEQAHREVERFQKLAAEGITSDLELSQRRANAAALDATVGQNRANLLGSSINVQYAAIRSPIDGRTGTLLVHGGNVVRPAEGRALVVIRSLEPMYVKFSVPDEFLSAVRARMKEGPVPVEARPRGAAAEAATGELSFVDNSVDPATGKIDMKGLFRNEGQILWPGQFVDVVVRLSTEHDAMVVPEAAVQTGQDGAYTYVVGDGNKASLRLVEVERTIGGETVVRKGLAVGERVVVDGQVRLKNGSVVKIQSAPPGAASADAPPAASAHASAGTPSP